MKSRAESMRRVAAVAKKNLRPVAEMVVMDNSSLFRTKMTGDAVHDFVDDITHCLVGVYEVGVEREAKNLRALEAERDALRLRVASLEAALLGVVRHERAGVMSAYFAPGGIYERCLPIVDHAVRRANEAIGGDTTALRAMLVEAYYEGATDWQECGAPEMVLRAGSGAYADRILGASKEGE